MSLDEDSCGPLCWAFQSVMPLISLILGAGAVVVASEGLDCLSSLGGKRKKVPDTERNIICFKYISQGLNY